MLYNQKILRLLETCIVNTRRSLTTRKITRERYTLSMSLMRWDYLPLMMKSKSSNSLTSSHSWRRLNKIWWLNLTLILSQTIFQRICSDWFALSWMLRLLKEVLSLLMIDFWLHSWRPSTFRRTMTSSLLINWLQLKIWSTDRATPWLTSRLLWYTRSLRTSTGTESSIYKIMARENNSRWKLKLLNSTT